MSIKINNRQGKRVILANGIKLPRIKPKRPLLEGEEVDLETLDPDDVDFMLVYVTRANTQDELPCTPEVYARAKGKYRPGKGPNGLMYAERSTFRLLVEPGTNKVTHIDQVPRLEVLHTMRRKDLEGVEVIKIEVSPAGDMKVVERPQEVGEAILLQLLKALDNCGEVEPGAELGKFNVLAAAGRYIEVETPAEVYAAG